MTIGNELCKDRPQHAWNGAAPTSWAIELRGTRQAVAAARAWANNNLGEDSPHAYAVELIVSELVTNAVLHSASRLPGGRVRVRLEVGPDDVKISVIDDGPTDEPGVPVETTANTGRGLLIVRTLAADCGEVTTDVAHRTWAYLAADDDPAATA